ncbi:GNAT family protein [Bacillus subtilis]|uniref:GNAT family N-acetyltransferase n=1 Tax=Bacillus subtilis TaxID=1423 RepID=UPI002DD44126|nr:GNAT family protein [Bacillus subtilis]
MGERLCARSSSGLSGHGFNERQFGKMTALIDPGNKASIRVAEKIGMHYSKTIRKWNKPIEVYERKSYN